jgi:hypothetical protein
MSGETKGSFDALLEEIGADLNKALPAAEAEKDPKAEGAEDGAKAEGEEGDTAEGADIAKSFEITLENGDKIQAVDGASLIKSLVGRIEKNEGAVLTVLGDARKVIVAQGELIKSLATDVAALKDTGKGRRTVLTIAEKPAATAEVLAKSEVDGGMSGDEFMAKALVAQTAGRITGSQVAVAEAYLNAHKPPPADIVRAVMADGK